MARSAEVDDDVKRKEAAAGFECLTGVDRNSLDSSEWCRGVLCDLHEFGKESGAAILVVHTEAGHSWRHVLNNQQ